MPGESDTGVRLKPFGSYLLVRRISAGGMADVYRARMVGTRGFSKSVAIKRIYPHLAESERFVRMFADEARIASRLVHPNIVQIHELGEHDGVPFIAMEYVPGRDLYLVVRRLAELGERLPPRLAVRVADEVAQALEHAHGFVHHDQPQEIVHRDVSPRNILLGWGGEVKLTDFGVARARDREEHTEHGLIKGKVRYLSPEAAAGQNLDRRSDLFSLGVVLAELLTMRALREGANDFAILAAIRRGEVDRTRLAGVPAPLEPVLDRALTASPAARYPTARAFREDLLTRAGSDLAPMTGEEGAALMRRLFGSAIEREEQEEQEVERLLLSPAPTVSPLTQPASPPPLRIQVPAGAVAPSAHRIPLTSGVAHPGRVAATGPERAELEGDLGETSLPSLLHRLASREALGRLDLQRPPVRKSVYLEDGDPVYVLSNVESELFGEHLVTRGAITRSEHARVLDFAASHGVRFSEALLALNLLPSHLLFRHLAEQSRERVLELFTWSGGRFAFFPGVAPPPTAMPLGLRTYTLIHDGVRSFVPLTVVRRRLDPARHRRIARTGGELPEQLQLSGREQRLLRTVETDPVVTIDELLRREHEEEQVLRLVYLGLELDLLAFG